MKTNGRIRELLGIACLNDYEYGHRVIWPLLDHLGVPSQARRPQFQIENPFGNGLLRLDYLIHHGEVPLVTIEGEPHAFQYDQGFRQAKNYSRNFKPRQRGCPMQEQTVPFLITAAGNRAEMCRAVVRGLNVEYEPIRQGGIPAFLEWEELLAEAGQTAPAAAVSPQQQVMVAHTATQFFTDLFALIDGVPALRKKDDQKIMLFNRVIDYARLDGEEGIRSVCRQHGLGAPVIRRLLRTIGWYRQKIESEEFSGPAVARGYRTFLLQPGGRGAHRYFTGEAQSRPYRANGVVRYRNVARYFTPTEIIQQMVRLARPRARERVIDMTCGPGGFLAECVDQVAQVDGDKRAQGFLTRRLVGIDDDPFCVSCARELLTFLYPQHARHLQVFLHNALYQHSPRSSEINEDPRAEPYLRRGQYDLVIGNPPGNDEYSGTNGAEILRQWQTRFSHNAGGLMDHHCFIRRAIELARPDGGRVCLLVPEGLLTRDNRAMPALRLEVALQCELRLVITLPRVFKDNNARMAIIYLVRTPRPASNHKVTLLEVQEKWRDSNDVEQTTDLFGELETLVGHHLQAQDQS
jgi:N-6 DNA Methylase